MGDHTHTHTQTHSYTNIYTYTYIHTYILTQTYTHTYKYIYTHTYTHTPTYMYIHTDMQHTHIHTHIHTHTYTHTCKLLHSSKTKQRRAHDTLLFFPPSPPSIFSFSNVGWFSASQGNLFLKCPFVCYPLWALGLLAWAVVIQNRLGPSRIEICFSQF